MISIIAAVAKNNVIGNNGDIPWKSKADMQMFKTITAGHAVVMGRKTYESIGRPLPNRKNIVVCSSARQIDRADLFFQANLLSALDLAYVLSPGKQVFVIGGQEMYRAALPISSRLLITEVDLEVDGDTFFPFIDLHEWKETARTDVPKQDREPRVSFTTLVRKCLVERSRP